MNKVDCSPEYIAQLWGEVHAELSPAPAPSGGTTGSLSDPEAEAKKRAATVSAIQFTLGTTFKKKLPEWEITPEETAQLAEAYADLVLWIWPDTGVAGFFSWWEDIMDRYGPLIAAVTVTGQVFGPRIAAVYLGTNEEPSAAAAQEKEFNE